MRNESWSGATLSTVGWDNTEDAKHKSLAVRSKFLCADNVLNPKPDVIFLAGGLNDTWSKVTTVGEVQYGEWTDDDLKKTLNAFCYIVYNLKKWNPHARIICIAFNGVKAEIKSGMAEACSYYGTEYLAIPSVATENGHPNQSGMTRICELIKDYLDE